MHVAIDIGHKYIAYIAYIAYNSVYSVYIVYSYNARFLTSFLTIEYKIVHCMDHVLDWAHVTLN